MSIQHVTIIVLTWNGLEYTRRCLETLRSRTAFQAYQTIVVDNGSSDGTVEFLQSLPWVKLICNVENRGFVAGTNQGIAAADPASDIVLVNNDIEILQSDWLAQLQLAAYESGNTGIVGCRLARPDGLLHDAGVYFPSSAGGRHYGANELDIGQYRRLRTTDAITFACVYIRRAVIERVGPLDSCYTSYYEDYDYCLKARAAGFYTRCCGTVTVLHHGHSSTSANYENLHDLLVRSRDTFLSKWQLQLDTQHYNRRLAWQSFGTASTRSALFALDEQGVEIAYREHLPLEMTVTTSVFLSEYRVLTLMRERQIDAHDPQVVSAPGDRLLANFGAHKIGFTTLGAEGLPKEWVRQANAMDEVWVPSLFHRDSFAAGGVTRPLVVMPPGIDPDYFNPQISGYPPRNTFTFLSLFEWQARKAPELLLRAFNDEFSANEDVVLICKVLNQDPHTNVMQSVRNVGLRREGGRVAYSLNEIIPSYQLGTLYRSAHCFVLPSRGEESGLAILQAMACGLPVIATDQGPQRDFLDPCWAFPLQSKQIPVPNDVPLPYQGLRWAEPSYEHLRMLMRYVFEHRAEAHAKGARAAEEVLTHWTLQQTAQRILDRFVTM